jgi:hypothetical protein
MTALLQMILCFLNDMIFRFKDVWLDMWDSLLSPADSILTSIGTGGLSVPAIPDEYAWMLGATGMAQALAIIATAMGTRFILQAIPFVRWGS